MPKVKYEYDNPTSWGRCRLTITTQEEPVECVDIIDGEPCALCGLFDSDLVGE